MSWEIKAGTGNPDFLPPTLKTSLRAELSKLSWKPVRRQIYPCGGALLSLVTWSKPLRSDVHLQQKQLYDKKTKTKPSQPHTQKKRTKPTRTRPGGSYTIKEEVSSWFHIWLPEFLLVSISFLVVCGFTFHRTNKSTKHQRTGAGQGSAAEQAWAEGAAPGPEQSPLCPSLLTPLQQHTGDAAEGLSCFNTSWWPQFSVLWFQR